MVEAIIQVELLEGGLPENIFATISHKTISSVNKVISKELHHKLTVLLEVILSHKKYYGDCYFYYTQKNNLEHFIHHNFRLVNPMIAA